MFFHVVTFSDSKGSVLPSVQSGAISLLPFITISILDLQCYIYPIFLSIFFYIYIYPRHTILYLSFIYSYIYCIYISISISILDLKYHIYPISISHLSYIYIYRYIYISPRPTILHISVLDLKIHSCSRKHHITSHLSVLTYDL